MTSASTMLHVSVIVPEALRGSVAIQCNATELGCQLREADGTEVLGYFAMRNRQQYLYEKHLTLYGNSCIAR